MSAEVKVAIKADNQLRTGLQQALGDVKKFGAEAGRAGSARGGGASEFAKKAGQGVRNVIGDLASGASPGQALASVAEGAAGVMGKLAPLFATLAAAGAAAVAKLEGFRAAFENLGTSAEATRAKVRAFSNDILSRITATLVSPFTGGNPIEKLKESARVQAAAEAQQGAFEQARKLDTAERTLGVAGDKDAESALSKQLAREKEISDLVIARAQARDRGDQESAAQLTKQIDLAQQRFGVEDRIEKARKRAAEDDAGRAVWDKQQEQLARDKERRDAEAARKPMFAPGNEESANGGWRVQAAEYERRMQAIDATRQQEIAAAMESSQIAVGSLQASDLQRIGGAGLEFADSRGIATDMKKQNELLKKIEENTRDAKLNLK